MSRIDITYNLYIYLFRVIIVTAQFSLFPSRCVIIVIIIMVFCVVTFPLEKYTRKIECQRSSSQTTHILIKKNLTTTNNLKYKMILIAKRSKEKNISTKKKKTKIKSKINFKRRKLITNKTTISIFSKSV